MWCPTALEVNGKETKYPLPEPYLPLNYVNSTGMRYEAEEVRQCLLKGTRHFRVWMLLLLYINSPRGGVKNTEGAPSRRRWESYGGSSCPNLWLPLPFPFRAEGEFNHVPCGLFAAGGAGGWNPEAGGGGVQPGQSVNEGTPPTSMKTSHNFAQLRLLISTIKFNAIFSIDLVFIT